MNTVITITVIQHPGMATIEILDSIEEAFGEFDRIVKKYTRFNQDSELSNLNRNQGKWVQITPEFSHLIDTMLKLSHATGGAFDPTIIDFLETYGYDPNYEFVKLDHPDLDRMVQNLVASRPSWKAIEMDLENHRVKLAQDQRIDLGGIGKGYAIDCAYDKLQMYSDFLVDAGGDSRSKGANEQGQDWKMGLHHKHDLDESPRMIGTIEMNNRALACSGSWARKVKQFHHIINPDSGEPTTELRTVFVHAGNATMADGWATALFVGGRNLLESLDQKMNVVLIDSEDNLISNDVFPFSINLL